MGISACTTGKLDPIGLFWNGSQFPQKTHYTQVFPAVGRFVIA